jgi:hypothetical protein
VVIGWHLATVAVVGNSAYNAPRLSRGGVSSKIEDTPQVNLPTTGSPVLADFREQAAESRLWRIAAQTENRLAAN